jgi:hypothetical protein
MGKGPTVAQNALKKGSSRSNPGNENSNVAAACPKLLIEQQQQQHLSQRADDRSDSS